MPWTEDEILTCLQGWADGLSYSLIALKISKSRNAVAGFLVRNGKLRNGKPSTLKLARTPSSFPQRRRAAVLPVVRSTGSLLERSLPANVMPLERSLPANVTLLERDRDGCAFPTTPDKPFLYCNQPRAERGQYCQTHRKIVFPR